MKIFILIVFINLVNICNSQTMVDSTVYSSALDKKINVAKDPEFKEMKFENGFFVSKYDNGQIRSKIEAKKKGKRSIFHGKCEHFNKDGKIIEEGAYYNNKQIGLWLYYDEKGNIRNKIVFK